MPLGDKRPAARAAHGDGPAGDAAGKTPAGKLDDVSLMLFEDGLRAHLPSMEDIVARAAARKRKGKATAGAAVLALALGLLWLDPAYRSEEVATAVGERATWTLGDGSTVALNTGSALRATYHLRSRQLHLVRGEALFTVAHSPLRSFVVRANGVRVNDIGTVFNVRATPDGARVTVVEGLVEVAALRAPHASRLLRGGQAIDVGADPIGQPYRADAGRAAAWSRGQLRFDATPLDQVVAELNRYRTRQVGVSPALAAVRITGQFDIGNTDQLLALLPSLAPVAVERGADGAVEITPRARPQTAPVPPPSP